MSVFVPEETAVKEAYAAGQISFPYWSKVWPSAVAMSNFLLEHPSTIQNKIVVEFGGGLGLPSLVAARHATTVACTDLSEEAMHIVQLSANYSQLTNVKTMVMDWQHLLQYPGADVVLLSDVNYDPDSFHSLLKLVEHYIKKDSSIILATPQRLMAKEFVAPLLQWSVKQEEFLIKENSELLPISVMVLQKRKELRTV